MAHFDDEDIGGPIDEGKTKRKAVKAEVKSDIKQDKTTASLHDVVTSASPESEDNVVPVPIWKSPMVLGAAGFIALVGIWFLLVAPMMGEAEYESARPDTSVAENNWEPDVAPESSRVGAQVDIEPELARMDSQVDVVPEPSRVDSPSQVLASELKMGGKKAKVSSVKVMREPVVGISKAMPSIPNSTAMDKGKDLSKDSIINLDPKELVELESRLKLIKSIMILKREAGLSNNSTGSSQPSAPVAIPSGLSSIDAPLVWPDVLSVHKRGSVWDATVQNDGLVYHVKLKSKVTDFQVRYIDFDGVTFKHGKLKRYVPLGAAKTTLSANGTNTDPLMN